MKEAFCKSFHTRPLKRPYWCAVLTSSASLWQVSLPIAGSHLSSAGLPLSHMELRNPQHDSPSTAVVEMKSMNHLQGSQWATKINVSLWNLDILCKTQKWFSILLFKAWAFIRDYRQTFLSSHSLLQLWIIKIRFSLIVTFTRFSDKGPLTCTCAPKDT